MLQVVNVSLSPKRIISVRHNPSLMSHIAFTPFTLIISSADYCANKGVTEFGHLRILENMLSEATKLRALCFLKLFLLVLMVGSENSRGHV